MPTLTDGIALMRLAEGVADLGAAEVLNDHNIALIRQSALDHESLVLLERGIQDEAKSRAFLDRLVTYAEKAPDLSEDEEPRLVGSLAALGTVLVSALADQPTGVFDIVTAS